MQQTVDPQNTSSQEDTTDQAKESKGRQEQSDPQLTELRGFTDPNEDLEPTLEDGTKSPDKAEEEYKKEKEK